jgi:subtilisin family serine protease
VTIPALLVAFREQADLGGARQIRGKEAKARFVFDRLLATAQRSQARAMQLLNEHNTGGNTLFIANALSVDAATTELVRQLALLPEVKQISADPWIFFHGPAETQGASVAERNGVEWGVAHVHAPEVWSLGFSGQGITVGGADTGYEWTHPALKGKYRGWDQSSSTADHQYNWHDAIHDYSPLNLDTAGNPIGTNPCGLSAQEPCDDHFHGTHTMGTMTGDDGLGNQVGVAPGARWVGCRNMERGWGRPSSYLECFQWFLAPTDLGGQNADPAKAPHVINNSWYCDYVEGCTDLSISEILHDAVINLKASGVFVVVSNGNFGSGCATTYGPPAYFEESFSVGAIRSNDTIANFSSRGPVTIDGSNRLKPNISAPGVRVRSSTLGGQYGGASGTSMAGPHVAGVVALVLSARPDLAGEVELLEDFLEETAYPLYDFIDCGDVSGTAVPNNTYGYGGVDALAAVQKALAYTPSSADQPTLAGIRAVVTPNPARAEALHDP